MAASVLTCGQCEAPLPAGLINTERMQVCPSCRLPQQTFVFPALFDTKGAPSKPETPLVEGESTCFYHPARKAVVPCESCGRFLCSLCEVAFQGQRLCLNCLEKAQRKGAIEDFRKGHFYYDNLALILGAFSGLFSFFAPLIAIVVYYLIVRHWKTPLSVLPRGRWRFVLAFLVQTAWMTLIAFFIVTVILALTFEE